MKPALSILLPHFDYETRKNNLLKIYPKVYKVIPQRSLNYSKNLKMFKPNLLFMEMTGEMEFKKKLGLM